MAENTFLGLQPYTEDDAYRFKGRTEESQELYRLIVRNDFTVCYAESGEGKTSLLNAGVFPLLRENMYFPIAITFTSDDYKVTPDNFDTIIDRCIKDSIADYSERNKGVNVEYRLCSTDFQDLDCHAELQQELSKYSWWKLRNYKPQAMGLTFTPVFVFDQFEEVFSLPGSIVWTKKFFDWLEDVSSDNCPENIIKKVRSIIGDKAAFPAIKEEKDFKAIFSLRKEFMGELDYWGMQKCFIPSLKDNRYCLKALTYEGAKKVMTQQIRFEEEKVEQILTYFVGQYTREPEKIIVENLPVIPALLLSVVCDSWEKDIYAFPELSTVEIGQSLNSIIERFYNQSIDTIVHELSLEDSAVNSVKCLYDLETALFALVDSNGKRVRTKTTNTILTQIDFDTKYKQILSTHRIIKITKVDDEDYVEIIHDCLCPVITQRREARLVAETKERERKEAKRIEEENRQMKLQNDRLNKIRSLFLSEKANSCVKNRYLAQMLALEALPMDVDNPDKPLVPQAEVALRKTIRVPYCPMMEHKNFVTHVWASSEGTQVFSVSRDGKICIWDAFSGVLLKEYDCGNNSIFAMPQYGDGKTIVVFSKDTVTKYLLDDFSAIDVLLLEGVSLRTLTVSLDGATIAVGLEDGSVRLYSLGKEMLDMQSKVKHISVLMFNPNGQELVALGDGCLNYCSVKTGEWTKLDNGVLSAITCMSYSKDGNTLFCGTEIGKIIIWSVGCGDKENDVIECENIDSKINAISISHDNKKIAYSVGGKLMILERDSRFGSSPHTHGLGFQSSKIILANDEFAPIITSIAWSPDGRYVLWGNTDGCVSMYDTMPGPQQKEILKASSFMKALKFSPNGNNILCLSYHNTFRIIEMQSGKVLHRENHVNMNTIGKEILSAKNRYRAVVNNVHQVLELYDGNSHKAKFKFGFKEDVTSVSFSSDSSLLAFASKNGDVICWDTEKGIQKYYLKGCRSIHNIVLFSPNGRIIATTAPNREVNLCDEKTGYEEYVIPAGDGYVFSMAFSPDGGRLAVGTESGTIKIWNVETMEFIDFFENNRDGGCVRCMAFSPDGEQLVASYNDGTVVLWECPSLKTLLNSIQKKMSYRKFTDEEIKKYYLE